MPGMIHAKHQVRGVCVPAGPVAKLKDSKSFMNPSLASVGDSEDYRGEKSAPFVFAAHENYLHAGPVYGSQLWVGSTATAQKKPSEGSGRAFII